MLNTSLRLLQNLGHGRRKLGTSEESRGHSSLGYLLEQSRWALRSHSDWWAWSRKEGSWEWGRDQGVRIRQCRSMEHRLSQY